MDKSRDIEHYFQHAQLSTEEYSSFKEEESKAFVFVDSLIIQRNEAFEKQGLTSEMSLMSSKAEKYEFLKTLIRTYEPTAEDETEMRDNISKSLDKLINLKIGKKEKFVPKPDLRFDEYLNIKSDFIAQDFKSKSDRVTWLVLYSHIAILTLSRLLRKAKMLWNVF